MAATTSRWWRAGTTPIPASRSRASRPRRGVVFAATPALRLRASYGEAFRAPALGELFYPFLGNPDLRPERGRSAEVGAQWTSGRWSADVAAFDSRQRDLIDYDFTIG